MKLKTTFRSVFWLLAIMVLLYDLSDARPPVPVAEIGTPVFEFAPAIAGQEVTHAFTIRNTGNAELHIPGVYSG